jgi:hypothetical protein
LGVRFDNYKNCKFLLNRVEDDYWTITPLGFDNINKKLRVIDYGTNGDGIVSVEDRGNDNIIIYIVAASANTSYVIKFNHKEISRSI